MALTVLLMILLKIMDLIMEFDNDDDCILYKWIGHIHDSINYTHTITTDFLEP